MRKHFVPMMLALCLTQGNAGCSPSSQSKALTTTFLTLETAQIGFLSFDKQHEVDISTTCGAGLPDRASSLADCAAKHAAYDKQVAEVNKVFKAASDALSAANKLQTDQTVAGAVAAAASLAKILSTLGINL